MKISEKITEFSKGLISSAADLVLFKIYLGVDWKLVGESEGEGMWQGLGESFPEIPKFDARKILRALRFLLKRGYIELAPSEAHLVPQITEEGGKRLDSIFPVYQKERPWDQKFYLINYDVPVGKNSQRDALRLFLKGLGCVMLQSSVWLTPHNPLERLSKFVEQKGLADSVVVSVLLDEWGAPAVAEVYRLEEINRRYREFTERVEGLGDRVEKMELAFGYFAILRNDPQIPFELLPQDWVGGQARELFEKLFFTKG